MDLDLDPALTPQDLRQDIEGTGAGGRVNPKLKSKGYNPNMDVALDQDPELTPQNDLIEGTGARVDSKLRSKSYNPNMNLS